MNHLALFNQYRSLLFALAYRMLGSVSEAEDIVQEAWIRWQNTETTVQSPKAFLAKIVTRLCIDYRRSARVRREQYVGTWLPEPLSTEATAQDSAELAESLSFAFLLLLECLSPTERAVFLLREVFDYSYADVAKSVGKSVPACRQIAHRARQHFLCKSVMQPDLQQQERLVEQFLTAWNQGNLPGLLALLTEDITLWSDGGGKVTAAEKPLQGGLKVGRFLLAIRCSRLMPTLMPQITLVNGQPGLVNFVQGKPHSIFSFEFTGSGIQSIFAVVNPEKLKTFSCDSPFSLKSILIPNRL
jgi:RNA polymerase sigma-70 factor, ECF subfamily